MSEHPDGLMSLDPGASFSDKPTSCANCSTQNTPHWHLDPEGRPICNICGVYLRVHGFTRPVALKRGGSELRSQGSSDISHTECNERRSIDRNQSIDHPGSTAELPTEDSNPWLTQPHLISPPRPDGTRSSRKYYGREKPWLEGQYGIVQRNPPNRAFDHINESESEHTHSEWDIPIQKRKTSDPVGPETTKRRVLSLESFDGYVSLNETNEHEAPDLEGFSLTSHELANQGTSGVELAPREELVLGKSSHILPEKAGTISAQTWKDIAQLLPESLRLGLQFSDLDHGSCWTFTPNAAFTVASVPLTIAGIPVVIPLKYRYPIRAPIGVPPDPLHQRIDPSIMVDEGIIAHVFKTFSHIVGFYVLINGFIQLLIPEDFNLEEALRRNPSRFGGLKVSYVPYSVLSTGSSSEPPTVGGASSTTSVMNPPEAMLGPSVPESTASTKKTFAAFRMLSKQAIIKSSTLSQLDFNSTLRVRVLKHRSPSWFGAMKALEETNYVFLSNDAWIKKVEVYHGNMKVGHVWNTFDLFASEQFPNGLQHDVSMIDVSKCDALTLAGLKSPKQCMWLTRTEWIRISFTQTSISLLCDERMRSKSITVTRGREQLVGQGIFKNIQDSRTRSEARKAQSLGEDPREEITRWSSFVSRAILYRVDPDFEEPRSNSGTAVCVLDTETGVRKVAGFQSFVQEVDGGRYYELEEDPFLDMLRLGSVAFYGAFEIPDDLRGYEIVTE